MKTSWVVLLAVVTAVAVAVTIPVLATTLASRQVEAPLQQGNYPSWAPRGWLA